MGFVDRSRPVLVPRGLIMRGSRKLWVSFQTSGQTSDVVHAKNMESAERSGVLRRVGITLRCVALPPTAWHPGAVANTPGKGEGLV